MLAIKTQENFYHSELTLVIGQNKLCINSRRPGLRPGLREGITGTRCRQGLVQGVASVVQGVTSSGIRCDQAWYKVLQSLVQGVTVFGTGCDRVRYKV